MVFTMDHTLTKILLMMAKNHLLNMMSLKLLVQGLQLLDIFHQLADKYNFHKEVSNMQILVYHIEGDQFQAPGHIDVLQGGGA